MSKRALTSFTHLPIYSIIHTSRNSRHHANRHILGKLRTDPERGQHVGADSGRRTARTTASRLRPGAALSSLPRPLAVCPAGSLCADSLECRLPTPLSLVSPHPARVQADGTGGPSLPGAVVSGDAGGAIGPPT